MADYTYRISVSGTATGADSGQTTLAAAIADFKANNRMGAGTATVAGSSTLYFKIDGFLSLGGGDLYGITVSASGAAIVVEAWSNPWNATARPIGPGSGADATAWAAFDGMDFGGSANCNMGIPGSTQAKLTVRNLVIVNAVSGYAPLEANGPADGSSNVELSGLYLKNTAATGGFGLRLSRANLRNSVVYVPTGTGITLIKNYGPSSGSQYIDHCVLVAGAGSSTLCDDQADPLFVIRNSYVYGCTTWRTYTTAFGASCVGNATNAASGWDSTSGTVYSVALDTNNFTNVTNTSEDFRVKAASTLATNTKTRLTSPAVTTDVFGTSRSDPTTIGAFAAEASGSSSIATIGGRLQRSILLNGLVR